MAKPTPEPEPAASTPDEEIARLKAEVERLQTTPEAAPRRQGGWWRPLVATLLIIIAALLAPVSVLATWARDEIVDTDRYVETIGPLADDPAVQDAIAARIEQVVYSYIDIDSAVNQLAAALQSRDLPPQVEATITTLAGPLSSAIKNFINQKIEELVQSDAFSSAWVEANRVAHADLVGALTGQGGSSISIDKGQVSVNLATIINTLKTQLSDAGLTIADRIPTVNATFTLVQSDNLGKVQSGLNFLELAARWIPVIALLLFAAAIMISRDKRRAIVGVGLAIAASMILLGMALNIIRPFYLDALPEDASQAAAGVVYDQLVSFIRLALRAVLVVGLVIAAVAWLLAPSGSGAAARRGINHGVEAMRSGRTRAGLNTGRFGEVLGQYRNTIRIGIVGLGALLYLLQDHPSGATALTFVIVIAVLLVLIEVLATPPGAAEGDTEHPDTTGPPAATA